MSAGGKYTNKIYQAVSPIHQLLLAVPGYESKRIRVVYLSIIVFVVLDHILSRIHQWLLAVPGYRSERIREVYFSRIVYAMLQYACRREINGPHLSTDPPVAPSSTQL